MCALLVIRCTRLLLLRVLVIRREVIVHVRILLKGSCTLVLHLLLLLLLRSAMMITSSVLLLLRSAMRKTLSHRLLALHLLLLLQHLWMTTLSLSLSLAEARRLLLLLLLHLTRVKSVAPSRRDMRMRRWVVLRLATTTACCRRVSQTLATHSHRSHHSHGLATLNLCGSDSLS